jgi:hypothetical protein
METNESSTLIGRISKLYLKEQKPFTKKRDVNWKALKVSALSGIVLVVLILLLMPTTPPETGDFSEKIDSNGYKIQSMAESNPTADTWAQMQQSQLNSGSAPRSLDYLNGSGGSPSNFGSSAKPDRSSSMIIGRTGVDSKTQLSPGSKIKVRLNDSVTLSTESVPVIATVVSDVEHEGSNAIPKGARVIGEIAFDESSERASVTFRSLLLPDGRERQISAIALGNDGQYGIEGKVNSAAIRNTVGQTLTRFIGAYADGSIQRGQLGASQGGHENGMKTAVAETAKDRAEAWAEELKKEKKWIEVKAGKEFIVIINQPYQFRDPGSFYGN